MIGTLWAVAAGIGLGLFQTVNRRAVLGLDVYMSTFIQLLVTALVLLPLSFLTENMTLLQTAPIKIWFYFALAGFVHFFLGWTFMNASQKQVGAARTTSLTGTLPFFGVVIAALTLDELPTLLAVGGMLLIMGGVYLVNYTRLRQSQTAPQRQGLATGWTSLIAGLLATLCWAISPIFIRYGLAGLPSPILGLTLGIVVSVLGYGLVLLIRGSGMPVRQIPLNFLTTKIIAGLLAALSMWAYWIALSSAPVALVLALSLLSIPIVILLSPFVMGRELEEINNSVWLGSGLIVAGSLMLIFF